jgi:two-component system, NtrC family, response regulator AlgB
MTDVMIAPPAGVLLIDDEQAILRTFRYCLEDAGFRVATASNAELAIAALEREVFDVCFLDLRLGDKSGLDLLPQLKAAAPWMRIVVATAHSSVDSAVVAMRAGAHDYLMKPCSPDQLRFAAVKQAQARRLEMRLEELEGERRDIDDFEVGSKVPAMAQVLEEARRVADTDASVLILGESGTGKGVLARAIHQWSPRRRGNLVTINCPSLSADLLESELFGHAKGAYTGATESTQGRVAQADGGTMFLDEIGDFPLSLQPKLLRFVQDKEYERVGDASTRRANVRIVAATNRELDGMVAANEFRQDLLYRLNVITLRMPPLRERGDDVIAIAERFLLTFARSYRRPARGLSDAAKAALRNYRWPGNVRELRNLIERAVILSKEAELQPSDLMAEPGGGGSDGSQLRVGGNCSLNDLERAHIIAVLASAATLDAAARTLGIDASTLYRKRKQFGI